MFMKIFQREYGLGFIVSLSLHALIIAFLMLSVQPSISSTLLAQPKAEIVQAVVIDESRVMAEVERLKTAEQHQKREAEAEIAKVQEARRAREQEQLKMDKLKREMAKARTQEMERLAELKLAKEKEKKQLDILKQEKEKEQKKLAALDDQRQAELDRVNQMRLEREKEEKKKEQLKNQTELKRKQEEVAVESRNRVMREAERILEEWKLNVRNNKRETLELAPELACTVSIMLLPDGSFHEVRVIESSGNAVFDDSVIHAVYKTPITMPTDVAVKAELKHFTVRYTNVE